MIDAKMIHKLKEYEDLLKEIQTYFYKDVVCRVKQGVPPAIAAGYASCLNTAIAHREFIDKINNVLFNPPKTLVKF
jgi:hypothetical protein